RIMIEPPEAAVAKQMREPVGAGIQFAIGHRLASGRHNEGGLKRTKMSMLAGVHVGFGLPTRPCLMPTCPEFREPVPAPRSCADCAAPMALPLLVGRYGRNAQVQL